MNLPGLRREVDRVDDDLVRLLNRRAALALEIGRLKRAAGIALYDPAREAEVVQRVKADTRRLGGPLDEHAIARLFERIIDEARQVEIIDAAQGLKEPAERGSEGAVPGREADGRRDGRTRARRANRTRRRPAR